MDRLQQLLTFLETTPEDAFTLYSVAYEYMNREEFDQALHYFQRLVKTDPNYIGTYYHLGKTLERTGKPEEAIATYNEGMARAKKLKDYHSFGELQRALNSILGLDYEDDL